MKIINMLDLKKHTNDNDNQQLKSNHLQINASQNILGKPGHRDFEGATWACYEAIPISPACIP